MEEWLILRFIFKRSIMYRFFSFLIALQLLFTVAFGQESTTAAFDSLKYYQSTAFYTVECYPQKFDSEKPKNIIFLIGDGMGVSQVYSGYTANRGNLFLNNFLHIGFSVTTSANNYVTDSAAGGTALSTGVKTYNGAIGVDTDTIPVKTILQKASEKGLATGLVSTSSVTHATPAAFIAHQPDRGMLEEIAADFLKTDIDVFIGGGYKDFTERKDGRNLVEELAQKGYQIVTETRQLDQVKSGKLAALTAYNHHPRVEHRGDMLPRSTQKALELLSLNENGFFIMIEGSQIDWAGHAKHTTFTVEEMLDFDRTIGEALAFAAADGQTLVVVTADHETGGMGINQGDLEKGHVEGGFTTHRHTGVMVPIFAYGPGAEQFMGIMDNTEIPKRMKKLLGL